MKISIVSDRHDNAKLLSPCPRTATSGVATGTGGCLDSYAIAITSAAFWFDR